MSVLSELRDVGGCAGGVAIYTAAKELARIRNIARKKRKLWASTKKVMKSYFPKLNLDEVEFCINSSLPPNWFQSPDRIQAMTFGYRIYFKGSRVQGSKPGLKLLMHELVHVDQVRRLGSDVAFACAYGEGYLKSGSYKNNSMEVAAVDFVDQHGKSLPDGVKKTAPGTHIHGFPKCRGGKHHKSCAGKREELSCGQMLNTFLCVHTT